MERSYINDKSYNLQRACKLDETKRLIQNRSNSCLPFILPKLIIKYISDQQEQTAGIITGKEKWNGSLGIQAKINDNLFFRPVLIASSFVQRKCSDREEKVQRKPLVSFIEKKGTQGRTAYECIINLSGYHSSRFTGIRTQEETSDYDQVYRSTRTYRGSDLIHSWN